MGACGASWSLVLRAGTGKNKASLLASVILVYDFFLDNSSACNKTLRIRCTHSVTKTPTKRIIQVVARTIHRGMVMVHRNGGLVWSGGGREAFFVGSEGPHECVSRGRLGVSWHIFERHVAQDARDNNWELRELGWPNISLTRFPGVLNAFVHHDHRHEPSRKSIR